MAVDLEKLTTPTTIFGGILTTAATVAMTAGDRTTQIVACVIAVLSGYALAYVIPSRSEVVKKSALRALPDDAQLTPRNVLGESETPDPAETDQSIPVVPTIKTTNLQGAATNFGGSILIQKKRP